MVAKDTEIHRIEHRVILPTLHVPDPANERYRGEAILQSILNTNMNHSRAEAFGGVVGTHWSTQERVPRSYRFDNNNMPAVQTGVPMSRNDARTIRRTNITLYGGKDFEEHKGPKLFNDMSGEIVPDARPFHVSVLWHGRVVDPELARKTENTWEHEIDLKRNAPVAVTSFSYQIKKSGEPLRNHLGDQFTSVVLPKPIEMRVGSKGGFLSVNEGSASRGDWESNRPWNHY